MSFPRPLPLALVAGFLMASFGGACATSATPPDPADAPPASPLAAMLGRPLVIMPTQYLAFPNRSGVLQSGTGYAPLLQMLDEEIATALRGRGVQSRWSFASEVAATARRNAGRTGDPYALSTERYRRAKSSDTPLGEPLASQLRALSALRGARYTLVPVELRLDGDGAVGQGTLRLLLVDTRTARIIWAGDAAGRRSAEFANSGALLNSESFPALARDVAARLADMIIPAE